MKRHILILTCLGLLTTSAMGCGDGSATPSAEPAATLPASSGEQAAEAALVLEAPAETRVAPTEETAEALAAPSPTLNTVDGLELRRLVVARDVEGREPIESGVAFRAEERPMFAFLELRNDTEAERRVRVTFEDEHGRSVGLVELEIPADVPRWRTWMRSRMVTEAGRWTARVHDENGELLGELAFDVAEG